jgi:hypothetical protein
VAGLSYEHLDADALVATRKQTEKEETDAAGVGGQTDKLVGRNPLDAQEEGASTQWELVK